MDFFELHSFKLCEMNTMSLKSKKQFDFSKDYIFENEVVKISPLQFLHIEQLIEISEDEKVWTYFLEKGRRGNEFANYCQAALDNRKLGNEYPFVIFDKRKNEYAGMTRLYNYNPELGVIKMGHTWIGMKNWGTKLNKHYKFLLFEFIFDGLGLHRVGFGVHGENIRSIEALKSIGCEQEGLLRNFLPDVNDENRIDLLLFSLLKPDWNSNVKARLKSKL